MLKEIGLRAIEIDTWQTPASQYPVSQKGDDTDKLIYGLGEKTNG